MATNHLLGPIQVGSRCAGFGSTGILCGTHHSPRPCCLCYWPIGARCAHCTGKVNSLLTILIRNTCCRPRLISWVDFHVFKLTYTWCLQVSGELHKDAELGISGCLICVKRWKARQLHDQRRPMTARILAPPGHKRGQSSSSRRRESPSPA